MLKYRATELFQQISERFEKLYGERAPRCLERLDMMIGRYGVGFNNHIPMRYRDQADSILITYGDMLSEKNTHPLATLNRFLTENLRGTINTVHILPFFPYSSDDGFSITDYRAVNSNMGTWKDIDDISRSFSLMFDLVLNHVSRQSDWFMDYTRGIAPARDYFIEVHPDTDLSHVTRPRSAPILSRIQTKNGERHVWTTFSEDQVDVDFENPDVLFEYLDILLFYISHGAQIIRLDAIAYLWKKSGTSCIHLEETHTVVKLIRDVLELLGMDISILTETNVPHEENISYFGNGDEAHLVYQFSLPPLLLHALISGDASKLTEWVTTLPPAPEGCTYINFTASHDGIGVRPLEGLIDDQEMQMLLSHIEALGGHISTKKNADASESPYELNITYLAAMGTPGGNQDLCVDRFLCSQAVMLALQGIPAIYFNSLIGADNYPEGVTSSGRARLINRQKWQYGDLTKELEQPDSVKSIVFSRYKHLLNIRARHPAFHPEGHQEVLQLGTKIFGLTREAPDQSEVVVAISNFSGKKQTIKLSQTVKALETLSEWHDLISEKNKKSAQGTLCLAAYETCWILLPKQTESE